MMNAGSREGDLHGDTGSSNPSRERSDTQLDPMSAMARRIERTYMARRETAKRLALRGTLWNGALVSVSIVSLVASVVTLVDDRAYGAQSSALLVVLGIAVLGISLLVANANYLVRAEQYFRHYRELQGLSTEAEWKFQHANDRSEGQYVRELNGRYQGLLDSVANHTEMDFYAAVPPSFSRAGASGSEPCSWAADEGDQLTLVPYAGYLFRWIVRILVTVLPIIVAVTAGLLLIPTVIWFLS